MRKSGILDTRDLDKRLRELQDLRDNMEELQKALESAEGAELTAAHEAYHEARSEFGEAEAAELKELENLENEVPGWSDGAALIPVGEFTGYCREMLEDIGDIPKDLPHYIVIDWEATADNIREDYSEAEYQGETYLYRNC